MADTAPQLIGVPPPTGAPKGKGVSAPQSSPVIQPNLGLFLGVPSFLINPKGLEACLNVRIKKGRLTAFNMGWSKFNTQALNGPVCMIAQFLQSSGTALLVAGTFTDLYQYQAGPKKFFYLTPIYATGTVTTTGATAAVVGVGTQFVTTGKLKPGDGFFFGNANQTDPTAATWFTVLNVTDDTHLTLTSVPPANAGVVYTARKIFSTATLSNAWHYAIFPNADVNGNGSLFQDLIYFTNNGVDYPCYWDGAAAQVVSKSVFAFKAKNIVRFKNTMIYINVQPDTGLQQPMSFINSDVGRPNSVVAGAASLAGQFVAAPNNNPLKVGVQLGDDLILYTPREVIDCSFVGAPDIWAFRTVIPNKGCIGDRLVASFPDFHQFLGPDGLYWFNGVQATAVDQQVWRSVSQNIDLNRADCSFVAFDEANGDLNWGICLTTDANAAAGGPPDFAYVANYLEGPGNVAQPYLFSVHPFPYTQRNYQFCSVGAFAGGNSQTWNSIATAWANQNYTWGNQFFSSAFPQYLVGGNNGIIYILNSTDTQDGVGFQTYALFPRRVISDLRHRSLIKRIYLMVRNIQGANYQMSITTTVYDQADQNVGSSSVNMFDLTMADTTRQWVNPYRRGRFMQMQVGTAGSATGQPWELDGYDIDVVSGGMR